MGYRPAPPPILPWIIDGHHPALLLEDESTFDRWIVLPAHDHRTLHEFAENPAPLVRRLPLPPSPPSKRTTIIVGTNIAYTTPIDTGTLKASAPPPPSNTSIKM